MADRANDRAAEDFDEGASDYWDRASVASDGRAPDWGLEGPGRPNTNAIAQAVGDRCGLTQKKATEVIKAYSDAMLESLFHSGCRRRTIAGLCVAHMDTRRRQVHFVPTKKLKDSFSAIVPVAQAPQVPPPEPKAKAKSKAAPKRKSIVDGSSATKKKRLG